MVPCSDVMPSRWEIEGEWYCAYPKMHQCPPPVKLNVSSPNLRAYDFTEGLGQGLYSEEQLERQREFYLSQTSRAPVLAKLTNAATATGSMGRLGIPLSAWDIEGIEGYLLYAFFPLLYFLGDAWQYVSTFMLVALVFKILFGAMGRMWMMYRHKGCGRWVLFAMWETLFVIITTPMKIVTQTVESMTAPLHDNGVGPRPPTAPTPPPGNSARRNPYNGPQRDLQEAQRRGVLFSALDDIRPPRWRCSRSMASPLESSFRTIGEEREEALRPLREVVRPEPQRVARSPGGNPSAV